MTGLDMVRGESKMCDREMNSHWFAGTVGFFRRFLLDVKGVAAIEFAFVAPLLMVMYFVTMEVGLGIEANKKVGRVGSVVADLVTQQQQITASELDAIMAIGEAIMQPYNRSRPKIVITAIEITDEATPKALVKWWRQLENGSFTGGKPSNQVTTVPASLNVKGTFLVRVDAYLNYEPVVVWNAAGRDLLGLDGVFKNGVIAMREVYHLRPRVSQTIDCTSC